MWPFSVFAQNRYRLAYQANWSIRLAESTYAKLDPDRKRRVDAHIESFLRGDGFSVYANRRHRRPINQAVDRLIAMHTLAIKPSLDGMQWPVPADVQMTGDSMNSVGLPTASFSRLSGFRAQLIRNAALSDQADADARRDLIALGLDISATEGHPLDDVHHYERGGAGRPVTWKEWLTRRRQ